MSIALTGKASRAARVIEPAETKCAISIIMPVYNTEAYLKECLDSILHQAFRDIELICVDDESTDGSLAVLRAYEAADSRVRAIAMPHGGQSAARNRGMREARGKYVYFMDSDDKLADGALETMYALIEERGVDVLYFDGEAFFDTEELAAAYGVYARRYKRPRAYREVVTGAELFTRMSKDNAYWVSPCLQIMRRDYMRSIGLQFQEGILFEDNISSLECMLQAGRASHENAVLFQRRIRENSTVTIARGFRHFYGYFACWIRMTAFASSRSYPPETRIELRRRLRGVRTHAIEHGVSIPAGELKENMRREPLVARCIYRAAFRMQIVRRARKNCGVPERLPLKLGYRLAERAGAAIGRALARRFASRALRH